MKLLLFKKFKASLLALCAFLFIFGLNSTNVIAQEDGEKLFKSYCASCHSPGDNQLVGPGLAGVYDKYEREWLYKWVSNSQELIKSGDADAVAIYEQYSKVLMPAQPVNNEQIDAILDYVKVYAETAPVKEEVVASADGGGMEETGGPSTMMITLALIVLFLVLISILRKVQHSMKTVKSAQAGDEAPEETSMSEGLMEWISSHKRIVGILGIVLIALVAKIGWDSALDVGIYTGYQLSLIHISEPTRPY